MRRLFAAFLMTAAAPALADDTTTSARIATEGLAATRAALEAAPPSADRDMALAAVTFLGGIEGSYQSRWRSGLTEIALPFPVIGTPLAPNPNPEPLTPDYINKLAKDLGTAMQATREVLPQEGDGAVVLNLSDIWFDIDQNGTRSDDELLLWLSGFPRITAQDAAPDAVRFDAADAHWLRAYTHLIEGSMTLIRAFDPEPEIARALTLREAVAAQKAGLAPDDPARMPYGYFDYELFTDTAAVLLNTLRHQPDPTLIAETVDHAHAMIAANRDFWTAVAAETDNDREWIPNDAQTQALGLEIPPGTGAAWVSVLTDAEKVLRGELLIPYWRFAPGYGIDLRKWLDAPAPIDMIDWVQGTAALEYTREGALIDGAAWNQFLSIAGGNAGLYMVMFN